MDLNYISVLSLRDSIAHNLDVLSDEVFHVVIKEYGTSSKNPYYGMVSKACYIIDADYDYEILRKGESS